MSTPDLNVSTAFLEQQFRRQTERSRLLQAELDAERAQAAILKQLLAAGRTLIKALFESTDPHAQLTLLRTYWADCYHTPFSLLYTFSDPVLPFAQDGLVCLGRHDRRRALFLQLFHHDRPLCDSLQDEHLQLLFGSSATSVRSTLLIPITQPGWDGLMVLGSTERDRYQQGPALSQVLCLHEVLAQRLHQRFGERLPR